MDEPHIKQQKKRVSHRKATTAVWFGKLYKAAGL
jgi:hypothetical protein